MLMYVDVYSCMFMYVQSSSMFKAAPLVLGSARNLPLLLQKTKGILSAEPFSRTWVVFTEPAWALLAFGPLFAQPLPEGLFKHSSLSYVFGCFRLHYTTSSCTLVYYDTRRRNSIDSSTSR